MCFGGTQVAAPAAEVAQAAQTPTQAPGSISRVTDKNKQRRAASANGTILSGSRGVGLFDQQQTGPKTLLGA